MLDCTEFAIWNRTTFNFKVLKKTQNWKRNTQKLPQ